MFIQNLVPGRPDRPGRPSLRRSISSMNFAGATIGAGTGTTLMGAVGGIHIDRRIGHEFGFS
jgi:uncharacterized membrane protein